jgi:hypothetical protein
MMSIELNSSTGSGRDGVPSYLTPTLSSSSLVRPRSAPRSSSRYDPSASFSLISSSRSTIKNGNSNNNRSLIGNSLAASLDNSNSNSSPLSASSKPKKPSSTSPSSSVTSAVVSKTLRYSSQPSSSSLPSSSSSLSVPASLADLSEEEKLKINRLIEKLFEITSKYEESQQQLNALKSQHEIEISQIYEKINGSILIIEDKMKIKENLLTSLASKEALLSSLLLLYQEKLLYLSETVLPEKNSEIASLQEKLKEKENEKKTFSLSSSNDKSVISLLENQLKEKNTMIHELEHMKIPRLEDLLQKEIHINQSNTERLNESQLKNRYYLNEIKILQSKILSLNDLLINKTTTSHARKASLSSSSPSSSPVASKLSTPSRKGKKKHHHHNRHTSPSSSSSSEAEEARGLKSDNDDNDDDYSEKQKQISVSSDEEWSRRYRRDKGKSHHHQHHEKENHRHHHSSHSKKYEFPLSSSTVPFDHHHSSRSHHHHRHPQQQELRTPLSSRSRSRSTSQQGRSDENIKRNPQVSLEVTKDLRSSISSFEKDNSRSSNVVISENNNKTKEMKKVNENDSSNLVSSRNFDEIKSSFLKEKEKEKEKGIEKEKEKEKHQEKKETNSEFDIMFDTSDQNIVFVRDDEDEVDDRMKEEKPKQRQQSHQQEVKLQQQQQKKKDVPSVVDRETMKRMNRRNSAPDSFSDVRTSLEKKSSFKGETTATATTATVPTTKRANSNEKKRRTSTTDDHQNDEFFPVTKKPHHSSSYRSLFKGVEEEEEEEDHHLSSSALDNSLNITASTLSSLNISNISSSPEHPSHFNKEREAKESPDKLSSINRDPRKEKDQFDNRLTTVVDNGTLRKSIETASSLSSSSSLNRNKEDDAFMDKYLNDGEEKKPMVHSLGEKVKKGIAMLSPSNDNSFETSSSKLNVTEPSSKKQYALLSSTKKKTRKSIAKDSRSDELRRSSINATNFSDNLLVEEEEEEAESGQLKSVLKKKKKTPEKESKEEQPKRRNSSYQSSSNKKNNVKSDTGLMRRASSHSIKGVPSKDSLDYDNKKTSASSMKESLLSSRSRDHQEERPVVAESVRKNVKSGPRKVSSDKKVVESLAVYNDSLFDMLDVT